VPQSHAPREYGPHLARSEATLQVDFFAVHVESLVKASNGAECVDGNQHCHTRHPVDWLRYSFDAVEVVPDGCVVPALVFVSG